jgi:hypothetical protein
MIRIVCPHCHAPLSSAELEQIIIDAHRCLVCPECATVLVSETHEDVAAQQPVETVAHA